MEHTQEMLKAWLGTGSINMFGMPFAGKDTQARFLAKLVDGAVISGGDVMRHSKDHPEVQKAMASGKIVDTALFSEIVLPHLNEPKHNTKPLILSEVGRMEGEQQAVIASCKESGHELVAVVYLKIDEREVFARFEALSSEGARDRGQRADDNKAVLQTRIDAYKSNVLPVLDWYREHNYLVEVDGNQPRESVRDAVTAALLARAQSTQ